MVTFDETAQKQKLAALRAAEEERLAKILAERYGLPYLDLSRIPIDIDALHTLPEKDAREGKLAVFRTAGKKLDVGVLTPKNEHTQMVVRALAERGFTPTLYMVSLVGLERAWSRYGETREVAKTEEGVFNISTEAIKRLGGEIHTLENARHLIDAALSDKKQYQTTSALELILAGAFALAASDIHLEPEEDYIRLRYRLNGMLVDIVASFPLAAYRLLLPRIKLLSGLKLNVHESAQDGRFSVRTDAGDIEVRTSVLPEKDKESVVLRILNPQQIGLSFEGLGLGEKLRRIVEREIKKPNGMIFTTGPTGSGKTTTLYAFLKKVHTNEIKIITIEDPIEYILPGMVQTPVGAGYSFADGLRSALRQDPDVIMVGEVRDSETASIAINASLTGHLVFSTLHTNSAAGTFPRLIDLGVNPKVISSAVNLALAQRLVRVLCTKCKKTVPLEAKERERTERLRQKLDALGIKVTAASERYVPNETGCSECDGTGFSGRIGIFEAIMMDEKIDEVVRGNPSESDIEKAAAEQGLPTMAEDGYLKMLAGITSLEELERVVDVSRV
ncbi:MAG: GspE/PulE family protein [bacterium]|nr:GspE/PulE family protein [bacterium]MDZ4284861.1 GspE/PulE family protein [Patescibacteria group bacterium]